MKHQPITDEMCIWYIWVLSLFVVNSLEHNYTVVYIRIL